jgi:hypothetical protein
MRRAHILFTSIAVAGVVGLSGCTAAGAETAPEAAPASAASTDALTCAGINDVRTIIANADAGLADGRMAAQEQEGWYSVAARVLDRLPDGGGTEVSEGLAALKELAPAVALGTMETTTEIGSTEWFVALEDSGDACTAAGVEPALEKFTGG